MEGDINRFGTGLQQEIEPLRTYDYERAFGAINTSVTYPSYYILPEDRLGVVKDQGRVGACVGCVMSSLAEVFEKIETNENVEFSEGWAYGALRGANDNYYGMYISQALEYWRKTGMIPKKYFNFLAEMPEIRTKVNAFPELYEEAERYKIKSYANLNYADTKKKDLAIKEAIYKRKHGLLAGSTKFFTESHCIMLVGWNDEKDTYIFKNSWGKNWGKNGISEIPKSKLDMVYLVTDEELTIPFIDVNKEDWYYNDVKNVYLGDLMNGITSSMFFPEDNLTRAQIATILNRIVEMNNERITNIVKILKNKKNTLSFDSSKYLIKKINFQEFKFVDVKEDAWYYNDIKSAFEYGLVQGHGNETYVPEGNITRAEMATVIMRIIDLFLEKINYILKIIKKNEIGLDLTKFKFSDVAEDAWYYNVVNEICSLDIMEGKGYGIFDPNGSTTRGETSAIINRLCKFIDGINHIVIE